MQCSVENCTVSAKSRGWCNVHYQRWYRHGDPLGVQPPRGSLREFFDAAIVSDTDECIEWPFGKNGQKYGTIWDGDRAVGTHRLMLQKTTGEVGEYAMHSCDNPPCINPRHLSWGTPQDNAKDAASKGRLHNKRKMTDMTRTEIADRYLAGGVSQQSLADEYGINQSLVSTYVKRRRDGRLTP